MTDPRYQDIPSLEIPEVREDDGTSARIITGSFWGRKGPVTGIATDPLFLDIHVPPNRLRRFNVPVEKNAFAYVFGGSGHFLAASNPIPAPTEYIFEQGVTDPIPAHPVENRNLILFDTGNEIVVQSGELGIRFLLVSGRPLKEPVAWQGPIVMNSHEELMTAFRDYREGTFIKKGKAPVA